MSYPVVHRFPGKFMELPRDHVNAYIVELERSVIVIDTTLAISSAQALRQKAESLGKPLEAVLLTHGHPDHYTGLASFADLPRYASQGCLEFAHREDVAKAAVATMFLGDDYPKERVFPDKMVKDGDALTFGGVRFTFRDLGPAESDSDGVWVFERDGVTHVFVGDTVSLNCHNFFADHHVPAWLAALDRVEKEFGESAQLYLGHGESPAGTEAIDWTRGYIKAFVNSVERLKQDGTVVPGSTAPIGRDVEERVIADMKKYLPSDATLFLLDYHLGESIADFIRR